MVVPPASFISLTCQFRWPPSPFLAKFLGRWLQLGGRKVSRLLKGSWAFRWSTFIVVIIMWDAPPSKEMSCQPMYPFFGKCQWVTKAHGSYKKDLQRRWFLLGHKWFSFHVLRFKTRHSLQKWLVCCPSSLMAHNFAFPPFLQAILLPWMFVPWVLSKIPWISL